MDRSNNRASAPACSGKVWDRAGGHGSMSGCLTAATQPWVLHPSSCRILPHPATPSCCPTRPCWVCVCRGVPCRAVPWLWQPFPWAGHGHAGRALCSKQHQKGERHLLILLSFFFSFNYRSYLSAENRKIVSVTLHLPL